MCALGSGVNSGQRRQRRAARRASPDAPLRFASCVACFAAQNKTKNKWVGNTDGFDSSKFYGEDRVLFLPVRGGVLCRAIAASDAPRVLQGGLLDRSEVPDYLDGTLAGECVPRAARRAPACACFGQPDLTRRVRALRSYGYDPLGLGKDGNVEKYREYEVRRRARVAWRAGWRLTAFR